MNCPVTSCSGKRLWKKTLWRTHADSLTRCAEIGESPKPSTYQATALKTAPDTLSPPARGNENNDPYRRRGSHQKEMHPLPAVQAEWADCERLGQPSRWPGCFRQRQLRHVTAGVLVARDGLGEGFDKACETLLLFHLGGCVKPPSFLWPSEQARQTATTPDARGKATLILKRGAWPSARCRGRRHTSPFTSDARTSFSSSATWSNTSSDLLTLSIISTAFFHSALIPTHQIRVTIAHRCALLRCDMCAFIAQLNTTNP